MILPSRKGCSPLGSGMAGAIARNMVASQVKSLWGGESEGREGGVDWTVRLFLLSNE